MLLPYVTFSLANTTTSGNINPLDFQYFAMGAVVGAVSLVLGNFVKWLTDGMASIFDKTKTAD